MTLDEFNQQLTLMENNLMAMYKQKSLLVAARETLRFQYATSLKSQWNAILSNMIQQSFSQNNAHGMDLVNAITGTIQQNIPMTDLLGNNIIGWGGNPMNVGSGGGVPSAGFLSPLDNLLSKPFNSPTNPDQSPAYKLYGFSPQGWGKNADDILNQYFLAPLNMNYGGTATFSLPPTIDWIKQRFSSEVFGPYIDEAFPYALSVLSGTYPSGTLQGVINDLKATLRQIIIATQNAIQLQVLIDAAATDLSTFVAAFSQFGATLDVSQILLGLQNAAELAAFPPPPPPPIPPEVLAVVPVSIIPLAPVSTSKLPWIFGAAVLGLLAMAGKKS